MVHLVRALSQAHTPVTAIQATITALVELHDCCFLRFHARGERWTAITSGVVTHELKPAPAPVSRLALSGTALRRSTHPSAVEARAHGASLVHLVRAGAPSDPSEITLGFGGSRKPPDARSVQLVGELLASAMSHAETIARVATISRRAQRDSTIIQDTLAQALLPDGIIARGSAMRGVLEDQVPVVARQSTTVLLRGESGTGKEVIARRIHATSRRANRPFLKLNCGALPEQLVESTLFGHERGAFTGATARHRGIFERADGGTLMLDEVAELPLAAQVKLLRVLQDGEFERVGGEQVVRVDVRVIAATHRSLEDLVATGAFRTDLFYRLNVFPIVLPPLRQRPEDIPALAHAALERLAGKQGRAAPRLSAAVIEHLQRHPWPGNVRELENTLERALLLTSGETLTLPTFSNTTASVGRPIAAPAGSSLDDSLRASIGAALAACGGRIFGPNGAATRLGVKPTTLQSKMKRLGVSRRP